MPTDSNPATMRERVRDLGGVVAGGAFMGAAEIVPGVSGGTIALVFGIYDRLIATLSLGSGAIGLLVRGDVGGMTARLREVDWGFLVALLVAMGAAILALTSSLEHLLETQPVTMSALFFGLILGSVVLALRELQAPLTPARTAVLVVVAVATFVLLGMTAGRVTDPGLFLYFGAAAIAICAMILPGISGSFMLLLMGMYAPVIAAVNDRDLAVLAMFAAGAVTGLALFSSFLHRVLEHHHDVTLAGLVGLMVGSLRVLWPWPAGIDGVADARLGAPVGAEVPMALGAGLAGIAIVVVIAWIGDRTVEEEPVTAVEQDTHAVDRRRGVR
ncbi:MAG TPA: DUF368 domain-containing protein [Nitriliruptoraceae bacterium]|nr:DUF368 domain-containing protein [Nitriliruptoraceae bacterium]